MYYLTKTTYCGPNPDENVDADIIEISTKAPRTNMSHEIRTSGWLGSSGDFSKDAYGEYETLQAAVDAMYEAFGDARDCDENGIPLALDLATNPAGYGDGVVAVFRPGALIPMGREWLESSVAEDADITADSTDAECVKIADRTQDFYRSEGYAVGDNILSIVEDRRDYLRERREQDS